MGAFATKRTFCDNAIKALVDKLKGRLFAYIGANQDVEAVAASISISNTLRFNIILVGVRGSPAFR